MNSLSDERCETAITYLAKTDEEAAIAKVAVQELEDEVKAIKAAILLRVEGSVEVRKALAETHENTLSARKRYYTALLKHERITNHRRTEERITELWRGYDENRQDGSKYAHWHEPLEHWEARRQGFCGLAGNPVTP